MSDDSSYHKGRCLLVLPNLRINVAVELCWMPKPRVWFGSLTAIRPEGDALADRIEEYARLYLEDGRDGVIRLRMQPFFGPDCIEFGVSGVGFPPFAARVGEWAGGRSA